MSKNHLTNNYDVLSRTRESTLNPGRRHTTVLNDPAIADCHSLWGFSVVDSFTTVSRIFALSAADVPGSYVGCSLTGRYVPSSHLYV